MTVLAALLLAATMATAQEPELRVQAERLARSGAHEEALRRFQALVAANPDDLASRLWIGRLHLMMGHPHRAAAVFESVVAADNQNVDALIGLGLALTEAGDRRHAADALNRAEALAPDRVDVLAAQGNLHAASRRETLALAYYDRALVTDPANAAIRADADAVRARRAHRVTLGYDFQRFDPSDSELQAGRIEVNARLNDSVRLVARGQALRHEDEDESRGGGGVEWLVRPDLRLRGGAQGGSDVFWLPELDAHADATWTRGRAHWTARLHFFDFDGLDMWIGGPGLAYDVTPRTTVRAEYLRGRTRVPGGDSDITDSGTIGIDGRVHDRLTASLSYSRGIDRLDWMTLDRVDAGKANTLSLEGSADLTPFIGVGAGYDLQERPGDIRIHRARGVLTVRF
jgi:tetratricopeptide (TPR) repeat protein